MPNLNFFTFKKIYINLSNPLNPRFATSVTMSKHPLILEGGASAGGGAGEGGGAGDGASAGEEGGASASEGGGASACGGALACGGASAGAGDGALAGEGGGGACGGASAGAGDGASSGEGCASAGGGGDKYPIIYRPIPNYYSERTRSFGFNRMPCYICRKSCRLKKLQFGTCDHGYPICVRCLTELMNSYNKWLIFGDSINLSQLLCWTCYKPNAFGIHFPKLFGINPDTNQDYGCLTNCLLLGPMHSVLISRKRIWIMTTRI